MKNKTFSNFPILISSKLIRVAIEGEKTFPFRTIAFILDSGNENKHSTKLKIKEYDGGLLNSHFARTIQVHQIENIYLFLVSEDEKCSLFIVLGLVSTAFRYVNPFGEFPFRRYCLATNALTMAHAQKSGTVWSKWLPNYM